jgi:hypothetical protein
LVIDTNAPLVGELAREPALSPDAAVDSLRIDVLDGTRIVESRVLLVPSPESWPVSLGVVPTTGAVTVRVRAFRGLFANAGVTANGDSLPEPSPDTTIDRLVTLDPASRLSFAQVVLDAACFGAPASFVGEWSSCVATAQQRAPAREGIITTSRRPESRRPARSPLVVERACQGEAPAGSVCVPGGFSVLGEPDLSGFSEESMVPLKPVVLSPFFLDDTELTVGRFRALVRDKKVRGAMPTPRTPGDPTSAPTSTP